MTDILESMSETMEKSKELREELLKNPEIDWNEKQQMNELLKEQKESLDEVKNIRDEMQKQLDIMKEKSLFSEETMAQFEKLQGIMDELMDSELFRKIQELQQKMMQDDMSAMNKMSEDLQEFNKAQMQFSENLQRTLDLFEDLLREEKLDELNKRLKQSIAEQENILKNSQEKANSELAEEENKLKNDLDTIQEFTSELSKEDEESFRKMMEEFNEMIQESSPSTTASKSAESFQKGDKQKAQDQAKVTKEKLEKLQQALQEMKEKRQNEKKESILNAFRAVYRKCIENSFNQEDLNGDNKDPVKLKKNFTSVSSRQFKIKEKYNTILEDLTKLSRATFFIDKQIAVAAGRVLASLNNAQRALEEGQAYSWIQKSHESLKTHNVLALILIQRMKDIESSETGDGMQQFMKQLQDMAKQQKGLNGQSGQMSLFGPQSGSKMNEMAKMAAAQQALRKSLAELESEMKSQGGKSLGDLGNIVDEMEAVVDDMRANRYNRRTKMRQQQILQRLLSASHSMKTRDKSDKRESESAKQIKKNIITDLPTNLGARESVLGLLREEILTSDMSAEDKIDMEKYIELLRNSGD